MSVIAEIALYPVGTGDASISQVLADSIKVLQNHHLKYEVTSTATNVEGDLDEILSAVREMDDIPFQEGAHRVILMLRVDDRRDKAVSMEYEESSVTEKLT
ncbi:MAG TPA: MTH1187 family thiamine-binding protein [Armatimonadota bacterium]